MSRPFASHYDSPDDIGKDWNDPPPWRNGPDARVQKRFELTPFGKISFDTTPAYLVKGLIPCVGLGVFWGAP